jgi:hypothetical protein
MNNAVAWFQVGDYVVAAGVLLICATWFLARQLNIIRLEIATRIVEADARLRALEESIADLKKRLAGSDC